MNKLLAAILLLTTSQALALEPPEVEWEMQYQPSLYSNFYNIHVVYDNKMLLGGTIVSSASGNGYLALLNWDGSQVWMHGNDEWNSQYAYDAHLLFDEHVIITGFCTPQTDASAALFVSIVDSTSEDIWTKVYDPTAHSEVGYCITPLPDGDLQPAGESMVRE